MTFAPRPDIDPLLRRIESASPLPAEERRAIQTLPFREVAIRAGQDVVREGDRPSRCSFILEGVACSYKATGQGRRQIVGFHFPGDGPDLQTLYLKVLDVSVGTITPCRIAFVEQEAVRRLCAEWPRITGALWRKTLADAAVSREWITSMGQRPAYSRIAHIISEIVVRFRETGLAEGDVIEFPLTNSELGEALGLSTVHVNRSLRRLRSEGLVRLKAGVLEVVDWEGLVEAGGFDPSYLQLEGEAAFEAGGAVPGRASA